MFSGSLRCLKYRATGQLFFFWLFQAASLKKGVGMGEKMCQAGWWFQIFFMFTPIWGNDPISLIFLRWVETTNYSDYLGRSLFEGGLIWVVVSTIFYFQLAGLGMEWEKTYVYFLSRSLGR